MTRDEIEQVMYGRAQRPVVDVLCPTVRKWDPEQVFSFTQVVAYGMGLGVMRAVRYRKWPYLDQSRNDLVRECLGVPGATHVLWLDDDMVWPHDLMARLLAHNVPVAGATYFTRTPPHDIVAGDFVEGQVRNLQRLPQGLELVGWVGLGAAMVETSVFVRMRETYGDESWFSLRESGEDIHFCRRLGGMGSTVHVDGSLIVGHVADAVITEEHWKHFHSRPDSVRA